MPTILADDCISSLTKIRKAAEYLDRGMIWSRTHEGEDYWRGVKNRLMDIVDYAAHHPEAVQGLGEHQYENTTEECDGCGNPTDDCLCCPDCGTYPCTCRGEGESR